MNNTIFLFGEAEKGEFCTPLLFRSLNELVDHVGIPRSESAGIRFAVQALMYKRDLIFYRVNEEGYSLKDYQRGIQLLHNINQAAPITAVCMPGVGDEMIIEAASSVCMRHKSMLIVDEGDLYDYLTSR